MYVQIVRHFRFGLLEFVWSLHLLKCIKNVIFLLVKSSHQKINEKRGHTWMEMVFGNNEEYVTHLFEDWDFVEC